MSRFGIGTKNKINRASVKIDHFILQNPYIADEVRFLTSSHHHITFRKKKVKKAHFEGL